MATNNENIIKEIVREGVIFGHKRSKTHPKMKPFIAGVKNEIELLNPEQSLETLQRATAFLKEKKAAGGVFMMVGTRPAAKRAIEAFAKEFGFPFVTERWLGGSLTNFAMIGKRIAHYEDLLDRSARGAFEKYTKKEQRGFADEIEKMRKNFEGLRPLKKLPDAVFFVDSNAHMTVVREAKRMNIPTIGIIDTNDSPLSADYPIFANDHSVKSIQWVLNYIRDAIK
jgi:small subunit ribosomal protein S2